MRVTPLLVAAILVAGAQRADAYPQFQFSTGAETCKDCHFSPAGGGLINEYGRDEAGSTLSMKDGNGGFLHGLWTPPESFQIGGDLRGFVCCVKQNPDTGAEFVAFPMQGEIYLRPKVGNFSLYLAAGVMPTRTSYIAVSREHYVQYENTERTMFVRAGRFYPVYGLRSQDHTSVVRRHLQMYLYEEPYTVSYAKFGASTELHVSGFVRGFDTIYDPSVAKDSGLAAYYEKRNADATASYGGQTKLTISDTDRRAWLGGTYKRWMEGKKLLVLAEADLGVQAFPEVEGLGTPLPLYGAVGYVGATHMTKKGLMIGGSLQGYDPDLGHTGTSRDSAQVDIQWFPLPHFEVHSFVKAEWLGLDVGRPIVLGFIQAHYYL